MRSAIRPVVASLLVGATVLIASGVSAHRTAVAYTPRVVISDNNSKFAPADADGIGEWGFFPGHTAVTQGEQIVFDSPASSTYPHAVASISWTGMAPDRVLESGKKFNSSPTKDQYIMPGESFTLDTSTLDSGQYAFYCSIHPWMLGSLTVLAPAQ